MVEFLFLIVTVASFAAAVALGYSATSALYPFLPPQFSDPLMSRFAFYETVFQPRIPLEIQFNALCSSMFGCAGFGSVTILLFLKSRSGVAVYLCLGGFVLLMYASIDAFRKYRANRIASRSKPSA